MREIGCILFGYRDDLDLPSKWWHRLLKVLCVLCLGALVLVVTPGIHRMPEQKLSNVVVLTTLYEFNRNHPEEVNTANRFSESPGSFGVANRKTGEISDRSVDFTQVFCAADLSKRVPELTEYFNRTKEANEPTADDNFTRRWLKENNATPLSCVSRTSVKMPATHDVLKYRFTNLALVRSWVSSFGIAIGSALTVGFVFLNLYYRGLIYVLFGKHKPQANVE